MNQEIATTINQPEVEHFPYDASTELNKLQEVVGDREYQVIPIGDAGYMVVRSDARIVAEAPWILLDFDDTAAKTTFDKKDRCWPRLVEMGLSQELIDHCDRISRVDFGKAGTIYQPELEMRLVTKALDLTASKADDEVILELTGMRREIVMEDGMSRHAVSEDVRDLYQDTRYSSTLYPDVSQTISILHGEPEMPSNVALLTYGDPHFQLSKTVGVMDENSDLSTVFLTKTKKGDFFEALMTTNPFKGLELIYNDPDETPQGVGIDFKTWQIMVTLFDDDPTQVESFNQFAKDNGIAGLGVVRVRRAGAKRSHLEVILPRGSAQVVPSDSMSDSGLFEQTYKILQSIILENFLLTSLSQNTPPAFVNSRLFRQYAETIAGMRDITSEEVRQQIFDKANVRVRGLSIDD